jgi:hypothetical protein
MLNRDSMVAVIIGLLTWSAIEQVDADDGAGLVGSIRLTRSSSRATTASEAENDLECREIPSL